MKDLILSGCGGYMGRVIASLVNGREDCRIVAGFDINTECGASFPVFADPAEFQGSADAIIDFSHPSALEKVLSFAKQRHIPAVVATTGYTPEQIASIQEAGKSVPVFFSANMTLGISLLSELAKKAARVLGNEFDIEIIEKHHNQKIDAPSGTALMLADAISEEFNHPMKYEYDRHSHRAKRTKQEIGLHAVRGGTIVGEHEIMFCGRDEVITLSHSAASKEVFAVGAVNAALFISTQEDGLYSMKDLIASK